MKLTWIAAVVASAMSLSAAGAATAATFGTISSANGNEALAPLGLSDPLSGFYDGDVYLLGGPADIEVTIHGAETGWVNTFYFGGDSFSTTAGINSFSVPGLKSWTVSNVASGLLNFWFEVNTAADSVTNGANNAPNSGLPNYFLSFLPNQLNPFGQGVLIFLNDDGESIDDDYDDLVVQLSIKDGEIVAPVPLPAAGLMLVGALGGLAVLRRRRAAA